MNTIDILNNQNFFFNANKENKVLHAIRDKSDDKSDSVSTA